MKNFIIKLSLLVLVFFCANPISAQNSGTGLLLQEDNQTPLISPFSGKKSVELKTVVDLKPFAPIPENQGRISSCVGWSVAYGAMTIMHAQRENWTDKATITANAFSPHFVYNQIARFKDSNCGSGGAYFSHALRLLMEQGVCKKNSFKLNASKCDVLPSNTQKTEASQYRVKDYLQLFKAEEVEKVKIRRIREILNEGTPVVVGMMLDDAFMKIKPGDKYWKPQQESEKKEGHAMVVVGYHAVKKEIVLMNSWGDKWGSEGFITMKQKAFAKHCVMAYQILLSDENESLPELVVTPKENNYSKNTSNALPKPKLKSIEKVPNTKIVLKGDFIFRYLTDWDDEKDEPIYEPAKVKKNGEFSYTLMKSDWDEDQQFKLMAKNIRKNRYVYVFSMDDKNKMHLHFPKMAKREIIDENGESLSAFGYVESPLVPYKKATIEIPSGNSAFEQNLEGDDHLFVLYSYYELNDIQTILKTIESSQLPFDQRLKEALGKRLIPAKDIQFDANKMNVKAKSSQGTILGLMLEAKAK